MKKKDIAPNMVTMTSSITKESKAIISDLSKRLCIRQTDLCGLWLSLIDPNHPMLVEKIRHIKVMNEVDRLDSKRNTMIAKIYSKGIIRDIANLNEADINKLIKKIRELKEKGK